MVQSKMFKEKGNKDRYFIDDQKRVRKISGNGNNGISDDNNASVEGKIDPLRCRICQNVLPTNSSEEICSKCRVNVAQAKVYGTPPKYPIGYNVNEDDWNQVYESIEDLPYVDQLLGTQHFGNVSGTFHEWNKGIQSSQEPIKKIQDEMEHAYWTDLLEKANNDGMNIDNIRQLKDLDKNPNNLSDYLGLKRVYIGNPDLGKQSIFERHGKGLKLNRKNLDILDNSVSQRQAKFDLIKLLEQEDMSYGEGRFKQNKLKGYPYYFQTLDGDRVVGFRSWKEAVEAGLRYVTSSVGGNEKWKKIIKDWSKLDPVTGETKKSKLIKLLQKREAIRLKKPLSEKEKMKLSPLHTYFIGSYQLKRQETVKASKQSDKIKQMVSKLQKIRMNIDQDKKFYSKSLQKAVELLNVEKANLNVAIMRAMKNSNSKKSLKDYIDRAIEKEKVNQLQAKKEWNKLQGIGLESPPKYTSEENVKTKEALENIKDSNEIVKILEKQKQLIAKIDDSRNTAKEQNEIEKEFNDNTEKLFEVEKQKADKEFRKSQGLPF